MTNPHSESTPGNRIANLVKLLANLTPNGTQRVTTTSLPINNTNQVRYLAGDYVTDTTSASKRGFRHRVKYIFVNEEWSNGNKYDWDRIGVILSLIGMMVIILLVWLFLVPNIADLLRQINQAFQKMVQRR